MTYTVEELFEKFGTVTGYNIGLLNESFAALRDAQGDLSQLSTTHKDTLVGALNELYASVTKLQDSALTESQVQGWISTSISNLINGAPEALDTLKELAAAIQENDGVLDTILAGLAKRVRVDAAQNFTSEEKTQGRDNIGAAGQEWVENDQERQDAMLNKLMPPDAESLDGQALVMAGTAKKSGYLSADADAAYDDGPGSLVNYLIRDPDFTLSTPAADQAINAGETGVLECWINGQQVDSFDLAERFDAAHEDGDQPWVPANSAGSKITVLAVGVYNTFWQKVSARMNIVAADLRKGYNTIELRHTGVTGGDQLSDAYEVFWDDAVDTPAMGAVNLGIHAEDPKWLSGVKYLGQNSQVKVSAHVEHIVDNSYVINPVDFYGLRGVGTTTVAPTDDSVSGLSIPPSVGEVMQVTDKVITLGSANQCTANGRITGRPRDPFGTYATAQSPAQNLLISTFGNRSTATAEYFDDENYRMPLSLNADDKVVSLTGQWDSASALGANDAQQYISADNEHSLMYPAIDFSNGYQPTNTANYAGRSGNQQYLRGFATAGAKSSIQFVLDGVVGGIGQVGSGDINLEIKLPGVGGWWDCAKPFGGSLGNTDGEGCLVGSINYASGKATVNATFGTNSSFGSNNRIYMRITLRNGNRIIKSVVTNW